MKKTKYTIITHIKPDWLLIYTKNNRLLLILTLTRIGSPIQIYSNKKNNNCITIIIFLYAF